MKQVKILVVDDNEINQFVAVKMLQRWGMYVKTARDGQEALTLIGQDNYHLVLMDLDMPVMDGYESTRQIRKRESRYFKTVPIIAFTASDIDDAKRKALEAGMTDLIMKPLQQEEIQSTIDKYVEGETPEVTKQAPLRIDFDEYTDGDKSFKDELITLMLVDLAELQRSLGESRRVEDPLIFHKAAHKAKTTLDMTNNDELKSLVEEIVEKTSSLNLSSDLTKRVLRFHEIVTDMALALVKMD